MASNPMQRKARNSFILGIVIATLLCAIVIVFLYMQINSIQEKMNNLEKDNTDVYVLAKEVPSGSRLSFDSTMYTKVTVNKNAIPSNAITDVKVLQNCELKPKKGTIKNAYDSNVGAYVLKYTPENNEQEFDLIADPLGNYYYVNKDKVNTYVEVINRPLIAKITLKANTILTQDMFTTIELTDDLRDFQLTACSLPVDLQSNDYVDLRISYPNGQDFIVASYKQVSIPKLDDTDSLDICTIKLNELDILNTSCSIIDAYAIPGAKLYVTRYTDPGLQQPATVTFAPSAATLETLLVDGNVNVNLANDFINYMSGNDDYDKSGNKIRNESIEKIISNYYDEIKDLYDKVDSEVQDERKNIQDQRSRYLKQLAKTQASSTTKSTNSNNSTNSNKSK